jgi:hypothetical protein
MRIISSIEGGDVRGLGAGGTKGAGLLSMVLPSSNVVAAEAGVHVAVDWMLVRQRRTVRLPAASRFPGGACLLGATA